MCEVKYDYDIFWAFIHMSLKEKWMFLNTVKCYWAAYSRNKKTLTTEKTWMGIHLYLQRGFPAWWYRTFNNGSLNGYISNGGSPPGDTVPSTMTPWMGISPTGVPHLVIQYLQQRFLEWVYLQQGLPAWWFSTFNNGSLNGYISNRGYPPGDTVPSTTVPWMGTSPTGVPPLVIPYLQRRFLEWV